MKIAYIGNFAHPHCTEVHVAAELETLGHQVLRLQEMEVWIPQADSQVRDFGAEMLLYTRTWSHQPEAEMERWLGQLSARGCVTVGFTLDLFWGIREGMLTSDPIFKCNHVFTADGGHQEQFKGLGINHHWLMPGIFSQEVGRGAYNGRHAHRLAFVGSQADGYHRQWPWRGRLLDFCRAVYGSDFARYGPGAEGVRGEQLASVYRSTPVIVGDSLLLGPRYWSDRIYETVGRGGLLVHPYVPELAEQFEDIVLWYEVDNLLSVHQEIEHALGMSTDEWESRTAAGIDIVKRDHTYLNRMAELLEVVGR